MLTNDWLKERRQNLGWSIDKLSKKSGYSKGTIATIEESSVRFDRSKWRTIRELIETMGGHFPELPEILDFEWLSNELYQNCICKKCFCEELGITVTFFNQLARGIAHVDTMRTATILKMLSILDYGSDPEIDSDVIFDEELEKSQTENDDAIDSKYEEKLMSFIKKGSVGHTPYTKRALNTSSSMEAYRMSSIKAAVELHYGKNVVRKLQEAETKAEIERIMTNAMFAEQEDIMRNKSKLRKQAAESKSELHIYKFEKMRNTNGRKWWAKHYVSARDRYEARALFENRFGFEGGWLQKKIGEFNEPKSGRYPWGK